MKPLIIHHKGEALLGQEGLTIGNLPQEFLKLFPEQSPKYIDNLSLLAGIAARRALEKQSPDETGQDFAVIVGSAFGAIDSTVEFDAEALLKGPNAVNPMNFPNTVANAAGSRIGIWLQLKGPNVTLTNGQTSFLDAMGFAFEGHNNGLFKNCLVGAFDKVPDFLKPLMVRAGGSAQFEEGACLLSASGKQDENSLFEMVDYFSLQLKKDFTLPPGFLKRFKTFWKGVEWLGFPEGTAMEAHLPGNLDRFSPPSFLFETGLGGWRALDVFLSNPRPLGVVGTFSEPERKIALIKISKRKRSVPR